ncbi:Protein VAC14 [Neolecta irregularis DAH-3]|uniref:Protein VAC14 n=1 Tax=Neolecta irregularis (strain DAH-3) TaxID=1198029 RepID=A0A1U7LGS2_NEOID|nr:Protein VAC14 [Neolecta irregularis DAH-3]|eukprot:OLL21855.1 Protein VAC14 [Neolecta irregularis DAH-3]
MYNIAKVAKGEILLYFNEVFDALCKLSADSELSVKNGAELLDRLVKDIVSEKAATYVSSLYANPPTANIPENSINPTKPILVDNSYPSAAFSLERFVPLLSERVGAINPFTRQFLVAWITLLDSIPDLELVTHLPAFLDGLFKFLADTNIDVKNSVQNALDMFLGEIKHITETKRLLESRKTILSEVAEAMTSNETNTEDKSTQMDPTSLTNNESAIRDEKSDDVDDMDGEWMPSQDVQIDYPRVIDILLPHLNSAEVQDIQLTAIRWIESFLKICPEDVLQFTPKILTLILPALSNQVDNIRQAAEGVSEGLTNLILLLNDGSPLNSPIAPPTEKRKLPSASNSPTLGRDGFIPAPSNTSEGSHLSTDKPPTKDPFDYPATVNALTLQLLNENERTRVAALDWLIMLHKKAPKKILSLDDGTFPDLLKTLSDSSEQVITRDLQLLAQVSSQSDDNYFQSFMVNLLLLFRTDRRLLETRGSLIIRQLSVSLNGEKIYTSLAEILEKEEDLEFASIMIQNINNNLITAPELSDLRKRLKNLDSKDGQALFVSLYKSWCHNSVSVFSLLLLAQAYEQAFSLLQIFADLEITVNFLIGIDRLVQLLESPIFTYLRLVRSAAFIYLNLKQLLEPEKHPYLFKCLYGLLMLLPQSSAFATLRNRLNSISSMGFLHLVPRSTTMDRIRPKARSDEIKWNELLDRFRAVQARHEKARRASSGLPERLRIATSKMEKKTPRHLSKGLTVAPTGEKKVSGTGGR